MFVFITMNFLQALGIPRAPVGQPRVDLVCMTCILSGSTWTIHSSGSTGPPGKGSYFPLQKNQNPDFGFPEGRPHQTERAGIFHLKKIKTLILDSPKGDYTRRKGLVFVTNLYMAIYRHIWLYTGSTWPGKWSIWEMTGSTWFV